MKAIYARQKADAGWTVALVGGCGCCRLLPSKKSGEGSSWRSTSRAFGGVCGLKVRSRISSNVYGCLYTD